MKDVNAEGRLQLLMSCASEFDGSQKARNRGRGLSFPGLQFLFKSYCLGACLAALVFQCGDCKFCVSPGSCVYKLVYKSILLVLWVMETKQLNLLKSHQKTGKVCKSYYFVSTLIWEMLLMVEEYGAKFREDLVTRVYLKYLIYSLCL